MLRYKNSLLERILLEKGTALAPAPLPHASVASSIHLGTLGRGMRGIVLSMYGG